MVEDKLFDKVVELLNSRPLPVQEINDTIRLAALKADPSDVPAVEIVAKQSDIGDQVISIPALAALPAWGPLGQFSLRGILIDGRYKLANVALRILLSLAIGESPTQDDFPLIEVSSDILSSYKLSPEAIENARLLIKDTILLQLSEPMLRDRLFFNLYLNMCWFQDEKARRREDYFFSCLTDMRLLINQGLIDEFRALIDSGVDREEELHRFFLGHPAFLDPLAVEIRSKHALGDDFKTDFVVRRINNEYVLVEIEKTTDLIFTQKGVPHSHVTEAITQVRNFQSWIHDNIAYARTKLPEIRRPFGLVVIGRRINLTTNMIRSLDEENYSRRGHIRIVTYDDLVEQAQTIYNNMVRGTTKFSGKKEIT